MVVRRAGRARGEVHLVRLDPTLGSEIQKTRPCLVVTGDQLRDAIRAIRRQTDRPFGVNLLLPPEVRPPMRSADLSDQIVQTVQTALNPLRAHLGLRPSPSARPSYLT